MRKIDNKITEISNQILATLKPMDFCLLGVSLIATTVALLENQKDKDELILDVIMFLRDTALDKLVEVPCDICHKSMFDSEKNKDNVHICPVCSGEIN